MSGKRYKPEQAIAMLREADILLGGGMTVPEVVRQLGVSKLTYYRWRKEYVGMTVEQAKRLKDIERENAQLKRLVADLSLDNAILKEAAKGNW